MTSLTHYPNGATKWLPAPNATARRSWKRWWLPLPPWVGQRRWSRRREVYLVQASKMQTHMIDQLMDAWQAQVKSPMPGQFVAQLQPYPAIGLGPRSGNAPVQLWMEAAQFWQRNWDLRFRCGQEREIALNKAHALHHRAEGLDFGFYSRNCETEEASGEIMTLRYTNEAEVLPTATTVSQGVTGHNVRYAWAFSLAGIIWHSPLWPSSGVDPALVRRWLSYAPGTSPRRPGFWCARQKGPPQ